jgi:ComF family protein
MIDLYKITILCKKFYKKILKPCVQEFLLLLFPINCAGCQKYDISICENCLNAISNKPYIAPRSAKLNLDIAVANIYNLPIRPIILQWKDHARRDLDNIITWRIIKAFQMGGFFKHAQNLTIVPIPSAKKAIKSRGFSQTKFLANQIQNKFPQINVENLLTKKGTASHKTAKKTARKSKFIINKNAINKSSINKNFLYREQNKPTGKSTVYEAIVLVDDVITTGSTIENCKEILQNEGYKVIGAAIIAEAN